MATAEELQLLPDSPQVQAARVDHAAGGADLSSYRHRRFIGYLGAALPPLVWLINAVRPTDGLERLLPQRSISFYYYTSAVAIFVGILFALAVFFFTYRGYNNDKGTLDRVASNFAAVCALSVAVFPTAAELDRVPSWWRPWNGVLHLGSAGALFASFIFFSLYMFRLGKDDDTTVSEQERRDRKWRNRSHLVCGIGMSICIVLAGVLTSVEAEIFWPEAIALWLFSISWMIKGRVEQAMFGKEPAPAAGGSLRVPV